jgi:FeS assembly SUF system protein
MELKDFIQQINGKDSIFREFSEKEIRNINKITDVKERIIAVLKLIYDPEISVNIWDLGLIYKINISKNNEVHIDMTLTSPTCPVADAIPKEIEKKIKQTVVELKYVTVQLIWEPKWEKSMMSEEAKFILDMF